MLLQKVQLLLSILIPYQINLIKSYLYVWTISVGASSAFRFSV